MLDIAGGAAADRDNLVLPMGQPARHYPSVEHSQPIIFFANVKRGKVMNGGNQRAGARPEETPVTGKMKHIKVILPSENRQFLLVPQNILYWVPEFLGHQDQLGGRARKIEQRQILFQSKKNKLMLPAMR
jgi:hypothetical protein